MGLLEDFKRNLKHKTSKEYRSEKGSQLKQGFKQHFSKDNIKNESRRLRKHILKKSGAKYDHKGDMVRWRNGRKERLTYEDHKIKGKAVPKGRWYKDNEYKPKRYSYNSAGQRVYDTERRYKWRNKR